MSTLLPGRSVLLLLAVAGLGLGALAGAAEAATLNVANNGVDSGTCGAAASPCRSISQAIANASAGDRIVVGPGRYGDLDGDGAFTSAGEEAPSVACSCMIKVDKAVTIESRAGAGATVLDAGGLPGTVVGILASGVVFGRAKKGFTLTGGISGLDVFSGTSGVLRRGPAQSTLSGSGERSRATSQAPLLRSKRPPLNVLEVLHASHEVLMDAQLDLAADLERRRQEHVERVDVDRAFARVLDGRHAEIGRAALDFMKHLVDRGHRQREHGMAEMLEHGGLRERAFGAQVRHLERLLLGETRGHELAEQPHHLLVAQRSLVAFYDPAQHLRLAFRAIELRGVLQALDDADLLRVPCALGDEALDALVDGVDLPAQSDESLVAAGGRCTLGLGVALTFYLTRAFAHGRSPCQASMIGSTRTDKMPSMPRMRASVASFTGASRSTSVYDSSSRE